jgi:hypothetical protein
MAILVNIGYVSRSTLGKGLEPKFQLNEIHLVKIGEEKAIISCRFDYFQCVEWEVVNFRVPVCLGVLKTATFIFLTLGIQHSVTLTAFHSHDYSNK